MFLPQEGDVKHLSPRNFLKTRLESASYSVTNEVVPVDGLNSTTRIFAWSNLPTIVDVACRDFCRQVEDAEMREKILHGTYFTIADVSPPTDEGTGLLFFPEVGQFEEEYRDYFTPLTTDGSAFATMRHMVLAVLVAELITQLLATNCLVGHDPEFAGRVFQLFVQRESSYYDFQLHTAITPVMEQPLDEIPLRGYTPIPPTPRKRLIEAGITTLGALLRLTSEEVREVKNLGSKQLQQIVDGLATDNYSLSRISHRTSE